MSYAEIRKVVLDNLNQISVQESDKTKKGGLKLNLPKSRYVSMLKSIDVYVPEASAKKTKLELYRKAQNLKLKPKWIGSTRESLRKLINENTQPLSTTSEIKAFFKNKDLNDIIYIKPNTLIEYVKNMKYNKHRLLNIGVLKDGEMTYRILKFGDNLFNLIDKINRGIDLKDIETHGSDVELLQHAVIYGNFLELSWLDADVVFKRNKGQFMPYYNKLKNINLKRYQFYWNDQKIDNEACFIYALRMSGIPNEEIERIKFNIIQNNLNTNDIKLIAEMLKIRVNLTYYDDKKKQKRVKVYNKKSHKIVNIGLVNNHYFINEQTIITHDAIKNYYLCHQSELFPCCRIDIKNGKTYILKPNKEHPCLMSYDLIVNIFKYNHVEPITMSYCSSNNTQKLIEYEKLREPTDKEIKPYDEFKRRFIFKNKKVMYNGSDFINTKTKEVIKFDVIFADFETFICKDLGYHIPYCVSYRYINEDIEHEIYGLDCAQKFLEIINKQSIIITHNLSFDFKMMQDYLQNIKDCIQTGTQLKSITAYYNNHKIIFKDNCAFLAGKLSELPSKFNLKSGDKEVYPYSLINKENFDKHVPMVLCLKHIDVERHDDFIKNSLEFTKNNVVDIKGYTIKYCKQDVRILTEAFCCFRNQIKEISDDKIDILHYISLPQVSDDFLRIKGCFDGCYKFSGITHDFIRRCVVGGRVMCRNNEKYHIKELLADFDAVSLYPSAMLFLLGYLKGTPQVIKNFNPMLYDHYFIEIRIDSVGLHRAFPLASIKNEEGIHNFTNELVGKHIFVDKTALEDLIEFQKIEYTFIRGYYFDEGFNDKINEVIKELFDKRLQLKKEGNPLQETYKLLMNSSYGKLCQKPINRKVIFKNHNNKSFHNFIVNNYENIVEYTQINDHLTKIVIKKSIMTHFAPVHLACQVLTMSKRIMNQVMCLAEDNDIKIYYQDTDSMHINNDSINLLSELFKKKYNKDLIGSNMGQFHSDFDVFDSEGHKNKKAENIIACESIFLGKKCYIDKLQYNNKDSDEIQYSYHMRMKGVCSKAIKDVGEPLETYKKLYRGHSVMFNLAPYCVMQVTKGLRMVARESFNRILNF